MRDETFLSNASTTSSIANQLPKQQLDSDSESENEDAEELDGCAICEQNKELYQQEQQLTKVLKSTLIDLAAKIDANDYEELQQQVMQAQEKIDQQTMQIKTLQESQNATAVAIQRHWKALTEYKSNQNEALISENRNLTSEQESLLADLIYLARSNTQLKVQLLDTYLKWLTRLFSGEITAWVLENWSTHLIWLRILKEICMNGLPQRNSWLPDFLSDPIYYDVLLLVVRLGMAMEEMENIISGMGSSEFKILQQKLILETTTKLKKIIRGLQKGKLPSQLELDNGSVLDDHAIYVKYKALYEKEQETTQALQAELTDLIAKIDVTRYQELQQQVADAEEKMSQQAVLLGRLQESQKAVVDDIKDHWGSLDLDRQEKEVVEKNKELVERKQELLTELKIYDWSNAELDQQLIQANSSIDRAEEELRLSKYLQTTVTVDLQNNERPLPVRQLEMLIREIKNIIVGLVGSYVVADSQHFVTQLSETLSTLKYEKVKRLQEKLTGVVANLEEVRDVLQKEKASFNQQRFYKDFPTVNNQDAADLNSAVVSSTEKSFY